MVEQLSLRVDLRDDATFDNFFVANNQQALSQLRELVDATYSERFFYLWGNTGSGRSHLLQAICHHAHLARQRAVYIPLGDYQQMNPEVLVDLEQVDIVTLDDVDAIAGDAVWEEALFYLYNRILASHTRFVVSANTAPRELSLLLPDLHSRFSAYVVFHLQGLSDEGKIQALQLRAKFRGLQLPTAVGHYLLKHYPRDMGSLFSVLELLLQESLATQKKPSVHLLRNLS